MKLKDYIELYTEDDEIVCFDKDIIGEFYFYKDMLTGKPEPDFPYSFAFNKYLIEPLDIQSFHQRGVTVNLYEFLNKPEVIKWGKEDLFEPWQYSNDEDIVYLLYEDVLNHLSNGYEDFCELMVNFFENLDKQLNVYKIPVVYQNWGLIDVAATSLAEAVKYAENNIDKLPLPENPQYIDESFEIDYDGIEAHNKVEKNTSLFTKIHDAAQRQKEQDNAEKKKSVERCK